MRLIVTALVLSAMFATPLAASPRTTPYKAVVDSDRADVRSGSGQSYAVTSQLSRGDLVTVQREDLGGWCMILPPPGSFDYIRADEVKRLGGNRGAVVVRDAKVYVGSMFGDEMDSYQRRLSSGDEVEIIGEKMLHTDAGPIRMLKIQPPELEYRWIQGKHLANPGQIAQRRPHGGPDPFVNADTVSNHRPIHKGPDLGEAPSAEAPAPEAPAPAGHHGNDDCTDRPIVHSKGRNSVHDSVSSSQMEMDQRRLDEIDEQFRVMVEHNPAEWDFSHLDIAYRRFREEATRPALIGQIDMRLAAVERYRGMKAEYDDFLALTSETSQRDAALASQSRYGYQPRQQTGWQRNRWQQGGWQQNGVQQGVNWRYPQPMAKIEPVPDPMSSGNPHMYVGQQTYSRQQMYGGQLNRPRANAPPQPQPSFDGAGIVQRTTFGGNPQAPQHMLMAPNGNVLAYLKPTGGVNLNNYVGQSMGIYGRRWHRPEMHADVIIVSSLTPVQLRP